MMTRMRSMKIFGNCSEKLSGVSSFTSLYFPFGLGWGGVAVSGVCLGDTCALLEEYLILVFFPIACRHTIPKQTTPCGHRGT